MEDIRKLLDDFIVKSCEYLPEYLPELKEPPEPFEFLSDYVNASMPFIIKHKEPPFQAVNLWKESNYLRQVAGNEKVTVAVTPDGQADAVVNDLFMLPEERQMKFSEFLDLIDSKYKLDQVYYLQKQDNNLIEELHPLTRDIVTHIPWATDALGRKPDAANIWIGNSQSVSSMHKDHYENIYYVITGVKKFELFPPVAFRSLPYKNYKKYQWYYEDKQWKMKDLNEEIKWISRDRRPETREKFYLYLKTRSFNVELQPGYCLYLPALWYHEVRQSDYCIAVNYWYDMNFDSKYALLRLYENLCKLPVPSRDVALDRQYELEDSLRRDLNEEILRRCNIKRSFVKK